MPGLLKVQLSSPWTCGGGAKAKREYVAGLEQVAICLLFGLPETPMGVEHLAAPGLQLLTVKTHAAIQRTIDYGFVWRYTGAVRAALDLKYEPDDQIHWSQ